MARRVFQMEVVMKVVTVETTTILFALRPAILAATIILRTILFATDFTVEKVRMMIPPAVAEIIAMINPNVQQSVVQR